MIAAGETGPGSLRYVYDHGFFAAAARTVLLPLVFCRRFRASGIGATAIGRIGIPPGYAVRPNRPREQGMGLDARPHLRPAPRK